MKYIKKGEMMSDLISTLASCLADLGMDVGKDYIKKRYNEKKLRESLVSFIEKQEKYNETCQLAEEIDFQGLIEYVHMNFMDDVKKGVMCLEPKEREEASEHILNKAVYYSKADTPESILRVKTFTANCLDIIKTFFRNKKSIEDCISQADMIDVINNNNKNNNEKTRDEIVERINRDCSASFFPEYIVDKANRGEMQSINEDLKRVFTDFSSTHPLYPYYGYSYKEQGIISEPQIPEALKKYPIRYKVTGPVRIGDNNITNLSTEVLNYAYRHQLKIVMKVEEAKKYLGDFLDPYQFEAEKLVGVELLAKPPAFPPAFACSLKVKDQLCFEYVLIRTQEILDDGTIVLSNREQLNTHFKFEFRVNVKDFIKNEKGETLASKGETSFNISITEASNEELLKYLYFIKAVITERELCLHVLENDQDLIKGKTDNSNYETGFRDIDEEIDFLERVCDIEEFYSIKLDIKGEILLEEYNKVLMISDLLRNKKIVEKWTDLSLSGNINEDLRKMLNEIITNKGPIPFIDNMKMEIFGTMIELNVSKIFYDAIIEDQEKIINLLKILNDGDPIKITLKPGENNRVVTSMIKVEEKN